ncbi:MAG: ABC transporter ATP-binding protein [Proteobacteria bacterium]|nr:ABC transporter ATP-binding protein [Pseudomonadota bacterium]
MSEVAESGFPTDNGAPDLPTTPARFCMRYARVYALFVYTMIGLEAGQAACSILLPYAIKQIMDAVVQAQAELAPVWDVVAGPFWLFAGLNLGVVLFARASGAILVILGPEIRRRVRRELFAYLQQHSQRYFMSNFAGSLANRIAEVAMSVAHTLWTVLFDFWPLAISFGVSLVLLGGVNLKLALVLAVWTGAYVIISFILASRCRRYARDYAAARSLVSGKIVDSVSNIMNAKLFARRDYERSYLEGYLNLEVKRARETYWFMEWIRWFQFIAAMILMLGIIGYALAIWGREGMTTGEFAMSASLALMLIEQARGLSRRFLEFFEYVGNINDGVNVIIRPYEVVDHRDAPSLTVSRGEIRFENVDFAYTLNRPVFTDFNLIIRAGERVGLVGYSGSGKTTMLNLILRLFEPQSGSILVDGQDIQQVTQESLRSAIAMIPQEPMLFHRTLMENIRYGRLEASDEEVIEAAHKAQAHEFIMETEDGYESLVGERGVKLSGGQRQRITLARAILKQAQILLLDEATSSLDSVTERSIQSSLEFLMAGKTVVVIAHRLSTLAHMDRIVVFHEGRVIEDGTHDELLERSGHYAHMWAMQAGGFLPDHDDEETNIAIS